MPQALTSLVIQALDETARIRNLQRLVEISLEQLDDSSEETIHRLALLLDTHRANMDSHLNELEVALSHLQQLLLG